MPPLNLIGDMGGGGAFLVIGILSALLERQKSGLGQVIDAAILDGTVSQLAIILGLRGGRALGRRARPKHPRWRRALLPHVSLPRWQIRRRGRARTEVLRHARPGAWARCRSTPARAMGPHAVARPAPRVRIDPSRPSRAMPGPRFSRRAMPASRPCSASTRRRAIRTMRPARPTPKLTAICSRRPLRDFRGRAPRCRGLPPQPGELQGGRL